MKGSTYRRCYCRGADGKPLGKACPQLSSRRHGVHAVRQELPARADGSRRSFSRSGYTTAKDAQDALDQVRALLAIPEGDDEPGQVAIGDLLESVSKDKKAPLPDFDQAQRRYRSGGSLTAKPTVGDWLDEWLAAKKTKKTTTNGYTSHVRVHLRPGIGHHRLDRFNVSLAQEFFDAIDDANEVILAENTARREQIARCAWTGAGRPPAEARARLAAERAKLADMKPFRRITGPATKQRIRATLRTALNAAIRRQLITFNPAQWVELAPGKRPAGLLWTDERVARWRETGEKPSPVMVWTPAQLGAFLDAAEGHRLYGCFHLIAHHGLRRGEAVGQDWAGVDFEGKSVTVATEIVTDGWTPIETAPKTDGSADTVQIDSGTVQVLLEHRARQMAEREAMGKAWQDSGKVFTSEDGAWLHPQDVTDAFQRIASEADLPPINLRDLRHGAAALIKAAGGDLHDAKVKLRHSTIVLTSDTYMTLFKEAEEELAEKAAAVVPRARRSKIDSTSAHASLTQGPGSAEAPREV